MRRLDGQFCISWSDVTCQAKPHHSATVALRPQRDSNRVWKVQKIYRCFGFDLTRHASCSSSPVRASMMRMMMNWAQLYTSLLDTHMYNHLYMYDFIATIYIYRYIFYIMYIYYGHIFGNIQWHSANGFPEHHLMCSCSSFWLLGSLRHGRLCVWQRRIGVSFSGDATLFCFAGQMRLWSTEDLWRCIP